MYEQVREIEFELSTACNAWCPGCSRYHATQKGLMLSPWVNFNQEIDLKVIENILAEDILSKDAQLQFCGTAGDPLAHTKFLEIVELIKQREPNARLDVSTNGGLKHPEYYRKVSEKMSREDLFKFNVDGLADTNHLYRRKVSWEKIVENAKAFNESKNCMSQWQFIIFPWNEHQVEEAEQLAYDLGFDSFVKRQGRASEDILMYQMAAADRGLINEFSNSNPETRSTPRPKNGFKDVCFSLDAIFVTEDGFVHPCCGWASATSSEGIPTDQIKEFYGKSDWNNLNKYSLKSIMQNEFWQRLWDSLYAGGNSCSECNWRCGVHDEKPHWDNIL